MTNSIIAAVVIGAVWVTVAIAATLLQQAVQDEPKHKAEPQEPERAPVIPRQREAVDETVEVDR
jgi:hypothetical protein